MSRTSAPRRRVAVLWTSTRRWSRRGREVLLGKQDLPKSAIAPLTRPEPLSDSLYGSVFINVFPISKHTLLRLTHISAGH